MAAHARSDATAFDLASHFDRVRSPAANVPGDDQNATASAAPSAQQFDWFCEHSLSDSAHEPA
jgi:hypothetical protein